ncbi:MAG: shikimate kinase [Brachybacterium sp.]
MTGPLAILIGPMAAGKTSVGRSLASQLRVDFADLDALIVRAAGRSIPRLFAEEGETAFRELEADILARALSERSGVLSLGGGAPMHPASAELLRGLPVVLLEVEEAIAARRLAHGGGRPMLKGQDPMARWRELADERGSRYRDLASHRIDSGHGSAAHVARTIIRSLQLDLPTGPEKETA